MYLYYYVNVTRQDIKVRGIIFKPNVITESPSYLGFPGLAGVCKPNIKPESKLGSKPSASKANKSPSPEVTEDITKGGKPDGSNSNK